LDANRLKSLPLFADVSDEELSQIATLAQEISVEVGRDLVREATSRTSSWRFRRATRR
jgi:CRP/FNR family transcriptional regulator, cyclic AMP receptor protein